MNNVLTTLSKFQPPTDQPPALKGMERINRYWDRKNSMWVAKILPGELYVSANSEMIVTVLGSCIAACIRDKVTGIGGMNHFMLPTETDYSTSRDGALKTRYGNWAMEVLINEILKNGGQKKYLEVKLFGGGNVVKNMTSNVGNRNIQFVLDYLAHENIPVSAEDMGGELPRKVYYFSNTGRCRVRTLSRRNNETLLNREADYSKKVAGNLADGSIELFTTSNKIGTAR
jgi:chemotaxis protein CheD